MPARPPCVTRPVTRRTTLGGALAGLGIVAGCDLDPPGSGAPAGVASPADDPDNALVAQVLGELTRVADLVAATGAGSRGLRAPMAALEALHVAHGAALGETIQPATRAAGRAGDAAQALAAVRTQERRLQSRLTDWSVAAESGTLARVLASMSAAVAQALVALPAQVVAR